MYVFVAVLPVAVLPVAPTQVSVPHPVAVKLQVAPPKQDVPVIFGALAALTVTLWLTLLVWFSLSVTVSVTV